MKFDLVWENDDRVEHAEFGTGTVKSLDYYNSDGDWVLVQWDSGDAHWFGDNDESSRRLSELSPVKPLPTPPKFSSLAEAEAWLEANA